MNKPGSDPALSSHSTSCSSESKKGRGLHYLAILTAICTLPLIFIGGLVTSHDAALAVPDWPTSFGYNMFLLPWSHWVGGIAYEHPHRLAGSVVGILMMILAVWTCIQEKRPWLRKLVLIALAAVIFQGILGGQRVVLLMKPLAFFHACFAQIFFCLISSIALFTSPFWKRLEEKKYSIINDAFIRKATVAVTLFIFIQLMLGAGMRHSNSGLAIPDFPKMYGKWVPPLNAASLDQANEDRVWKWNLDRINLAQLLVHLSHRIWAFVVTIAVMALYIRIRRDHRGCVPLNRLVTTLLAFVFLQLLLGMSVIWSQKAADVATAHVVVGALTLVTSFLLTVISFKLVAPTRSPDSISVGTSKEVAA